MAGEVTRRQLLGQAGSAAVGLAGLAGLGMAGCAGKQAAKAAPEASVVRDSFEVGGYRRFVTRPDLNPPVITFTRHGSFGGHVFLNAPYTGPRRGGAIILDSHGDLVWMGPDTPTAHRLDFNTQLYRGEPVLTWWEGLETHGWGEGVAVVADSSYRRIHTIQGANGLKLDHHEFTITPQGTALVTIFRVSDHDLRSVGGPAKGVVVSGVAQEIDIATGKLLFEWDSIDHVPLTESQQAFAGGTAGNPYDYFHINSIAVAPDGDLLISARNTWTVYKVARPGGTIVWRMNGKKSDFTIGPGAHFFWQHHARPHGSATLSIFDNGAKPNEEKQSRAIVLAVDDAKMTVTLEHQYVHPGKVLLSAAEGSAQLLPDGRMFVGWGTNPYFSEFAPDGTLIVAGAMTKGNPAYRVFTGDWTGHPTDVPAAAARHRPGGATVYASWNGATNMASWTILAGKKRTEVSPIAPAPKVGFETAVAVRNGGPYFAVRAHDASGHILATSAVVKIA